MKKTHKTTRKVAVSLVALMMAIDLFAQGSFTADLPVVIPPSPDAAAFVKAGVGNANLSTGALSLSIPLYTIKMKDFSFPISLSYSTQGLKVDEAPSRVGQNWVLNAGGTISRSVRGEPDEFSERMAEPADFLFDDYLNTDALYLYYLHGSTPGSGYDTQPDEFQFNVNGHSGKFVLDDNLQPRMTSTNNIEASINMSVTPHSTAGSIDNFIITTPDGVKYRFGTNYEITSDLTFAKYDFYKLVLKTAFFLDRIELPSGEYIDFNYTSIAFTVAVGTTQTLKFATASGPEECGACNIIYGANNYSTTENKVSYNSRYLSNITASNGVVVNFTYADNSTANSPMLQDKRLVQLEVVGQKKYSFAYYDVPASSTTLTGRFFLTKLTDITGQFGERLVHSFSYDRLGDVPLPGGLEQDYLGFYNSRGPLIPPATNSMGVMDFSGRNPNWQVAKIGTLTQVEYPTGGKEDFVYEANTVDKRTPRNTNATYALSGPGGGSAGSPEPVYYTNNAVTVPFDQVVTLSLDAEDALPNDGFTADSTHHSASLWVYEGATMKGSRSVNGYGSTSTTFTLQAGHTYQLKLKVESYTEEAFGTLTYNTVDHIIYDTLQVHMPGVRLAQIKYTDPYTNSTYSKYYTYSSLEHLGQSSGGSLFTDFIVDGIYKAFCGSALELTTECTTRFYTSSTTNTVYSYSGSGSPIYYRTVIESDDSTFLNGGTEYTFFDNEDGVNKELIRGMDIPYIQAGHYPTLSGVLFKKRIFDRSRQIVQEEQNDYETVINLAGMPLSIYIRQNYQPVSSHQDRCNAFDVVKIQYGNYWNRLKSTTVTNYAGGTALARKTDYTYGTAVNILPASILTTDSKGLQRKTELKYPTITIEEPGADPALVSSDHSTMVSRNLITPVIQETLFHNGALQQQKRTLYRNWVGNTSILAPERIQLKHSPSDVLEDALIFKKYDDKGNPIHFQKADDISMAYVWDVQTGEPIAEARNALPDQIAFTSFENAALGNWSISSGSVESTGAYTGTSSFTGSIQKSVSTIGTQTYLITLWTSNPTIPTVNSVSGTKLRSSNGFDLYQWKIPITGSGTITLVGTQIDEVRMLPEEAQMQSYTYKPFIGVTSADDTNNRISFYTYDNLNRLVMIKDQDGNVIKTIDYHYKQQN